MKPITRNVSIATQAKSNNLHALETSGESHYSIMIMDQRSLQNEVITQNTNEFLCPKVRTATSNTVKSKNRKVQVKKDFTCFIGQQKKIKIIIQWKK